jgi:hypothetical protein
MPLTLRGDGFVKGVLCIQRIQDLHSRLQCVDTGFGDRGVRHLAMHRYFQLQAAVVRGDDLVAETGGNQQIGW